MSTRHSVKNTPFVRSPDGGIFVEVVKLLPIVDALSFATYVVFDEEPNRRYVHIDNVISWAERNKRADVLKLMHKAQRQFHN
jgi:hypothetical protein